MPKKSLAVRTDEDPWTNAELASVKDDLNADLERLQDELDVTAREIQDRLRDGPDSSGSDQADLGSNALERDSELSLAANQRDLLLQTQRALERLGNGSYGLCESCGDPIGKMRLMAFPRATLCMLCKRLEERR